MLSLDTKRQGSLSDRVGESLRSQDSRTLERTQSLLALTARTNFRPVETFVGINDRVG